MDQNGKANYLHPLAICRPVHSTINVTLASSLLPISLANDFASEEVNLAFGFLIANIYQVWNYKTKPRNSIELS